MSRGINGRRRTERVTRRLRLAELNHRPDLLIWAWIPPFLGAGIGVCLATVGRGTAREALAFSATSEYITWVTSVAAMIAVWVLVGLACVSPFLHVRASLRSRRWAPIAAALVGTLALIVIHIAVPLKEPPFFFPLPYYKLRLAALALLAGLGGFLPLTGMWSMLVALGDIGTGAEDEQTTPQTQQPVDSPDLVDGWSDKDGRLLQELVTFRSNLQVFLGASGVVIGATTLSVGALRNAMIASELGYDLPVEHVLLYGFMLTVFLATIYVPVDLTLTKRSEELLNRVRPYPISQFPGQAWVSERERLAALLHLQKRPLDSFRNLLAVFAPFLGSVASILIPVSS